MSRKNIALVIINYHLITINKKICTFIGFKAKLWGESLAVFLFFIRNHGVLTVDFRDRVNGGSAKDWLFNGSFPYLCGADQCLWRAVRAGTAGRRLA